MILTIDIGNSNIVSVTYSEDGKILADDRRATQREDSKEIQKEIFLSIKDILDPKSEVESIILSCVVPSITKTVIEVLEEVFNKKVSMFNYSTIKDMKVVMDNPETIGQDLLATNVGAYKKYDGTTIIADLGSATKIMVIDESFRFIGGIIMPGIYFQAKSLHDMIPQLPIIDIKKPEKILGDDTVSCIQSGIINGSFAAIVQLSEDIEKELGRKCNKILTGGLSKVFVNSKSDLHGFKYDEFLLNDGLYFIYRDYLSE